MAALLWAGIVWLQRTRARLAMLGVGIVGVVYLVASRLGLQLTAWILQGFVAVFVFVVVVVFQDDLRRLFEQIAVWGLRRRPTTPPPQVVEILTRSVARLARTRTGALVVLPGLDPLDRHIEGGIELDARISEPLLLSLFDASSPGHDGAVLVEGDRATHFAVHLPLSTDRRQLGQGGTRHAAGLGLSERADALCVVVSEERGVVSVARDGLLRVLPQPEALASELRSFIAATSPSQTPRARWRDLVSRWREGLTGFALAVGVWVLVVPGAGLVEVERLVPVTVENIPPGYAVENVEPSDVQVTLSGPRWEVYFADPNAVRIRIDALLVQLGRRTFQIDPEQVERPEGFRVLRTEPAKVRLSVRREGAEETAQRERERREAEAAQKAEPVPGKPPAEPEVEKQPGPGTEATQQPPADSGPARLPPATPDAEAETSPAPALPLLPTEV